MAIHDLTLTPSPLIKVQDGVTLASVSVGVHEDSQASLSGAVGSLDGTVNLSAEDRERWDAAGVTRQRRHR